MGKWLEKTLGELTSFMTKGIPPKYVEEVGQDTIRVLNQKCNRNYRISYSESRIHDNSVKKAPEDKMLRDFDVLINSTGMGTAGRVAQIWHVPEPTTLDGHMILMRPTQEMDPLYYGYAIKSFQSQIEGFAEGSTGQTEINKRRLQDEIVIRFPASLDEQKAIGRMLKAIDEKIRNNEELNENLAALLQCVYQQKFGNAFESASIGQLAEICDYAREKVAVSTLTPSTYYSTENMLAGKAGAVDASSLPTVAQTTKCAVGDVLISNIRPYFKKIVYCQSEGGCSTDVLCFHPKTPDLSAYLFCTLYADCFFDFMVAGSKGTKMPRGDKQQIMTYLVNIPSSDELCKFNAVAIPVLLHMEGNRAENVRLSALRNTLLPKLMSGELDVSAIDL